MRDRFGEMFGEGEQPVRRKTPIVRLIIWAAGIGFALMPPAIGAAVARYRL